MRVHLFALEISNFLKLLIFENYDVVATFTDLYSIQKLIRFKDTWIVCAQSLKYENVLIYSKDLINWRSFNFKSRFPGQSITSGDKDITFFQYDGSIYRTSDIVNWKFVHNVSYDITRSIYGNNRFVFASRSFTTVYSLEDNTFKRCEVEMPDYGIELGYHSKTKKYYMTVGGSMFSSDDGCKWAIKYLPATTDVSLADAGENMIAAGGRGITYFSDGD